MTKILVIEDEKPLLDSILQLLGFSGYESVGAPNGLIGLQMAFDIQPDLIICDIRMPEIDGFDVIKELNSDPSTADIPFIFLTAKADIVDRELGEQLGASAYITKPFVHNDLLSTISSCVG